MNGFAERPINVDKTMVSKSDFSMKSTEKFLGLPFGDAAVIFPCQEIYGGRGDG